MEQNTQGPILFRSPSKSLCNRCILLICYLVDLISYCFLSLNKFLHRALVAQLPCNVTSTHLTQGLCICSYLILDPSSPRYLHMVYSLTSLKSWLECHVLPSQGGLAWPLYLRDCLFPYRWDTPPHPPKHTPSFSVLLFLLST